MMDSHDHLFDDRTPGVEERERSASFLSYSVGLGLAILATIASFVVSQTDLLWPPGIPVGLIVLAFAQIGVHLVFFLHLGSGPDHTNNILALAFGVLIVFLVIGGSIWIMANLNHLMMPMDQPMQMPGQRLIEHLFVLGPTLFQAIAGLGLERANFPRVERLIAAFTIGSVTTHQSILPAFGWL